MTTAMFAVPGILAPLQGLFRWFAGGALPSRCTVQPAGLRKIDIASEAKATESIATRSNPTRSITTKSVTSKLIATYALPTRARGISRSQTGVEMPFPAPPARSAVSRSPGLPLSPRPPLLRVSPALRVVRVLEAGQAPACVGRMVISGRMADVCAELDRLAAREAALH